MRELLEAVVSEGSGRNCKIEGYSIGGGRLRPVKNCPAEQGNIFPHF